MNTEVDVHSIAAYLKTKYSVITPLIGVVCGSGLSELTETHMIDKIVIPYSEIPNFPNTTGKQNIL